MKIMWISMLLLASCFTCAGEPMDVSKWKEDILSLKSRLPERHKNLFFQTDKTVFNGNLNALIEDLKGMTDLEISLALQLIISEMGDDHTGINYFPLLRNMGKFPIKFYWFADGLYVLATTEGYARILGNKLVSINGISTDEVTKRLSGLLPGDNEALLKHRIPNILPYIGILQYFNIVNVKSAKFTFEDEVNSTYELVISSVDKNTPKSEIKPARYKPASLALCWFSERTLFWSKTLEDENLLYVQYNKCSSRELEERFGSKKRAKSMPSFSKFTKDIIEQLKGGKINKFVFDMRFNSGGSSAQGTEFVKTLAKIEEINREGHLFVIVGKRTYSSAIINALDFKEHTKAIIVGEPTSGQPNHYGEIRKFQLPNSGLLVTYSTKYFKMVEEDVHTLNPDIRVETTFDEFAAGIDPVLEAIIKY